ncbi:MAG: hypothetical protein J6I61_10745 [Prevotella sp.]|nr:hypothetical protein [Prevotella sp.]
MTLPFHIIEMLRHRSANDLRRASSCDALALDIESKTGQRIGSTTLKRLLGFVSDDRKTYHSTLDIIATYLGFNSWEDLAAVEPGGNSGFDEMLPEVQADNLPIGEYVRIAYLPDREVLLRYLGNARFRVVESMNSKLQSLDEIQVSSFILNYPLHASHVWRAGKDLGAFTAGATGGLTQITIEE